MEEEKIEVTEEVKQAEKSELKDFIARLVSNPRFRLLILITILIVFLLTVYSRYFYADYNQQTDLKESIKNSIIGDNTKLIPKLNITQKQEQKFYSTLDGIETTENKASRRPVAVIIENHPDARPQVGLNQASHVWEVVVEGGITRFMAVFAPADTNKVGPVRSARTFFVSWANGYQALLAHAGGSQGGLAQISRTSQITDLPHTSGYFWREAGNVATEHTLFTSTEKLYALAKAKKASSISNINITRFADELSLGQRPVTFDIDIDFSLPQYHVEWVYDQKQNFYQRMLAGFVHQDRITGEQLTAKNIVVLEVARSYDPNTNQGKGEWFLTTEGTGKAKIFRNGGVVEGTWKKAAKDQMLQLFDQNNNEILLVRGRTWFEVVEPGTLVTYK